MDRGGDEEREKETMMRSMSPAVEAGGGMNGWGGGDEGGCLLRVLLFSDSILSANMDLVHGWSWLSSWLDFMLVY